MAQSQLLGATKNKGIQLEQSQRFERQQRDRAGLNGKIHFLQQTIPLRIGEIANLSDIQKQTQKVKENEKTKKYALMKKQDKTPETEFNTMKISDLPNRVQNNVRKFAYQDQENNA